MIGLKTNGDQFIRRDACIVIDNVVKKFGTTSPVNFILPDWKGDFRAIKKRILIASRTNNTSELIILIKRMNTVILTNKNRDVREDSIEILIKIAEIDHRLIDEHEETYVKAIVTESNKNVQKLLNELLRIVDRNSYYEDFEDTLKVLKKPDKSLKIIPKYDFENDFIRYKVQIVNNTNEIIWDARYTIVLYEKNYILREIKPDTLEVFENNVIFLNVIQPGDMKEILIKIEPKSSQIYLEGNLRYKKYNDNDFSVLVAKELNLDLINEWPVLDTLQEKVSIVYCRELFDFHVKHKSMNAFALPPSISPELAYTMGKRILIDFKFSLVMDIMNQDSFFGEGLFYAKITPKLTRKEEEEDKKPKVEEIVVILRSSYDNKSIEINIGTNTNAYLVSLQMKFDLMFKQLIKERPEYNPQEKIYELRCPNCYQVYDKIDRDWCPWCGEDIDKSKLSF